MEIKNDILAVITARANSKGLKGKNYKNLFGRPLVQWSCLAAVKSKHVDNIIVSTNCNFVKQAVMEFCDEDDLYSEKIFILDRPEELATDFSKNEEAMFHALNFWVKNNSEPDMILNLQPTSPARTNNLIDKSIERIANSSYDSLFTVSKHTPFFWKISNNGPIPYYDVANRPMRQEISDWMFHDNGNIYLIKTDVFVDKNNRIGYSPFLYETDKFQSLQIDIEEDFMLLEKMADIKGGLL